MTIQHVQTKREIEAMLQEAGLRPRKKLGQHFLIDGNLMRRLVKAAQICSHDLVIEVGGGTGGLTDLLVHQGGRIICVEIDRELQNILRDRFYDRSNFTLITGDVLEKKHQLHPQLVQAIKQHDTSSGSIKLVSNFPYQVATPLVMNLLVDHPRVQRLVFTVQTEVGERIIAQPGTKAYGPLSIIAQTLCQIETVARLPAHVFWPRPAVESVMIRMDVHDPPFADRDTLRRFSSLVRTTFEHRRKTLRSALGYVIDEARRERVSQSFDVMRRPESFTKEEWLEIFRMIDVT